MASSSVILGLTSSFCRNTHAFCAICQYISAVPPRKMKATQTRQAAMKQTGILAPTPRAWLAGAGAAGAVHFFCPSALSARHSAFRRGFPGTVTFAVKANPAKAVIAQLITEGMRAFDVASPGEIAMIRALSPKARLHYHNPVRSADEITIGIEAGVASWSVDCAEELEKLADLGAGGVAAVRFKLPAKGAAYDFGAKFGAEPAEAVALLRRAHALGFAPGLTFHVGTQCAAPDPWRHYLAAAGSIIDRAGVAVAGVNVGGGFAAGRDGTPPDHAPVFAAIAEGGARLPGRPPLTAEPGRGLVADAFQYAARIKGRRAGRLYLTDGIYGALSEAPSLGLPAYRAIARTGAARSGPPAPFRVFGPTCDSLDELPGPLQVPSTIAEGDWLLFSAMGAYVTGVSTRFNGYGDWQTALVAGL